MSIGTASHISCRFLSFCSANKVLPDPETDRIHTTNHVYSTSVHGLQTQITREAFQKHHPVGRI